MDLAGGPPGVSGGLGGDRGGLGGGLAAPAVAAFAAVMLPAVFPVVVSLTPVIVAPPSVVAAVSPVVTSVLAAPVLVVPPAVFCLPAAVPFSHSSVLGGVLPAEARAVRPRPPPGLYDEVDESVVPVASCRAGPRVLRRRPGDVADARGPAREELPHPAPSPVGPRLVVVGIVPVVPPVLEGHPGRGRGRRLRRTARAVAPLVRPDAGKGGDGAEAEPPVLPLRAGRLVLRAVAPTSSAVLVGLVVLTAPVVPPVVDREQLPGRHVVSDGPSVSVPSQLRGGGVGPLEPARRGEVPGARRRAGGAGVVVAPAGPGRGQRGTGEKGRRVPVLLGGDAVVGRAARADRVGVRDLNRRRCVGRRVPRSGILAPAPGLVVVAPGRIEPRVVRVRVLTGVVRPDALPAGGPDGTDRAVGHGRVRLVLVCVRRSNVCFSSGVFLQGQAPV